MLAQITPMPTAKLDKSDAKKLERLASGSASRMQNLTAKLEEKSLSIAEWQRRMRDELADMHVRAAILGNYGDKEITQAGLDILNEKVESELGHFMRLSGQVAHGEQEFGDGLDGRLEAYSKSAYGTMEDQRRAVAEDKSMVWERRVLDEGAEHCEMCADVSEMGWQPLGALPEIGATTCLNRCRCWFEYSEEEFRPDFEDEETPEEDEPLEDA